MSGRFERSERLEHQTLGVQRLAVRSEDYWDYKPEQRVQTIDGVTGVVKHVDDGPFPGSEEYHVELEHGMGGGRYTASQLRPAPITTEAMEQTAAADYPELAQILVERPDPALQHVTAAKAAPFGDDDSDEDDSSDDSHDEDDDSHDDGDDSDEDDSKDSDDSDDDSDDDGDDAPPWAKNASRLFSDLVVTAATDSDFRFHVTAAWRDVVEKAKRIRSEGRLRVTMASDGLVYGEVKGDHEVYETGLQRMPGKTAAHSWSCGCKWGAYHWGAPDDFSRFAGRMCSHALALQYEAQSRGMFGRDVHVDEHKPSWVPRKVVVRYDIDADKHRLAPSASLKTAYNPFAGWGDEDDEHGEGDNARSKEWDDIHSGLDGIHRGLGVHLHPEDHAIVHDESRPLHERAQHLLKSLPRSIHGQEGSVGWHWTSDDRVAESFGETGSKNPAKDHDGNWREGTSVVLHAHTPDREDIDESPESRDSTVYGYYDHGEREVPLHSGASVHLQGVSWKPMHDVHDHAGDLLEDHSDREYTRHDFSGGHHVYAFLRQPSAAPALSVIARAVVAAGEDHTEVALAVRTVTANQYMTGESNWDEIHPHLGDIHRGIGVRLRPEDHAVVHDKTLPMEHRVDHLMRSLHKNDHDSDDWLSSRDYSGFGRHWTEDHDVAHDYAEKMGDEFAREQRPATAVVFHSPRPERHSIDEEPNSHGFNTGDVYDFHHGESEVPIRPGADVHLKGVSFKPVHSFDDEDYGENGKGDEEYEHHEFAKPRRVVANANAPFGEPSGTSYVLPKAPGATQLRKEWENPASAGPLAGADPAGWNRQLPLQSYAGREEALFEPGGTEAVLHDEPEAALPATDGTAITPSEAMDLTPSMTAGLRRQALKDFTVAEQQALINEGENVRAANLDRLDIKGTHYADLEQVLAAQEDDTTWLA